MKLLLTLYKNIKQMNTPSVTHNAGINVIARENWDYFPYRMHWNHVTNVIMIFQYYTNKKKCIHLIEPNFFDLVMCHGSFRFLLLCIYIDVLLFRTHLSM